MRGKGGSQGWGAHEVQKDQYSGYRCMEAMSMLGRLKMALESSPWQMRSAGNSTVSVNLTAYTSDTRCTRNLPCQNSREREREHAGQNQRRNGEKGLPCNNNSKQFPVVSANGHYKRYTSYKRYTRYTWPRALLMTLGTFIYGNVVCTPRKRSHSALPFYAQGVLQVRQIFT